MFDLATINYRPWTPCPFKLGENVWRRDPITRQGTGKAMMVADFDEAGQVTTTYRTRADEIVEEEHPYKGLTLSPPLTGADACVG